MLAAATTSTVQCCEAGEQQRQTGGEEKHRQGMGWGVGRVLTGNPFDNVAQLHHQAAMKPITPGN